MGRSTRAGSVYGSRLFGYAAGVQAGHEARNAVVLANAPAGFVETLEGIPDGVEFTEPGADGVDFVLFFATHAAELLAGFEALRDLIVPAGMFWVAWPKRASKVPTDITEDRLRELILPSGWVDTKVCAIDATWSGLRFVRRKGKPLTGSDGDRPKQDDSPGDARTPATGPSC